MQSTQQRSRLIILHASLWAVYITFFIYVRSSFQQAPDINWPRIFTIAAIHIFPAMILSYATYFYLLPNFLFKKRVALFVVTFITALVLIVYSRIQLERLVVDGFTFTEAYLYRPRFTVQTFFSYLSIVLFVSLLRFAVDWFDLQATRKEIEKEKLTAELNFLKAQVNPHFLFNTLNNLYYLAYSKSENTTEVIEKLSQMMRYMIYDSNYPKVQLSKEIDYMQNYISLEKLRLGDKVNIQFVIEGEVDTIQITPFILLTFLENAFKHGVSNTAQQSFINVSLTCASNQLQFKVMNSRPPAPKAEEKSGIGLQNVRRRLELSYPGHHRLDMNYSSTEYRVQLDLTLL